MSGHALKLIRLFYRIKQGDLAENLKISNSYLSEIESGKKDVTLDLLKKYSDYFDIPVSSLMLFSENLENGSVAERFRINFTAKIKQIMEWVVAKDDHIGAKKI